MSIIGIVLATVAATAVVSVAASGNDTTDNAASSGNLVRNGDFSDGLTGWKIKSPGTMSVITPGRAGDAAAVRIGTTQTATVALNDKKNTVASTTVGAKYHVSAWVRTLTPNVTLQLRVREVTNGKLSGQGATELWLHDHDWHAVSFDYTSTTTGGSLDLNVVAWQLGVGHYLDIDDISMTSGSALAPALTAPTSATVAPTADPTTPAATATVSQPAATSTSSSGCHLSPKLVPSCGALWGIYTKPTASQNWETAFTDLESQTGRQFDIVKRYHDWSNAGGNGQFPDKYEQALGASGKRILYFAWVSNNYSTGGHAQWSDIAAGKYDDSVILPEAARLKAWGKPVFVGYDHEADGTTRTSFGTSAEYVAAFRHIHDVFAAAGVTNVVWVYNPTGYLGNEAKIDAMYPGDAYVDWIAWDPYNFYTCHNSAWKDPSATFSSFYDYLESTGHGNKPFMLGEYGSQNNSSDPSAVGDWYSQVAGSLKSLPNIKAAIMWNSTDGSCNFNLTTNSDALQGFAQSGLAASLQVNLG